MGYYRTMNKIYKIINFYHLKTLNKENRCLFKMTHSECAHIDDWIELICVICYLARLNVLNQVPYQSSSYIFFTFRVDYPIM